MPYKNISELPDPVKSVLPPDAQKLWMDAYNRADKDRKRFPTESRRAEYAWGTVKKVYKKGPSGKWIKKSLSQEWESLSDWVLDIYLEELQLRTTDIVDILPKRFWEVKVRNGVPLPANNGKMLWEGRKTEIVSDIDLSGLIGEPLHLIEDRVCYGVIRLQTGIEVPASDLQRYHDSHLISEEEQMKRWPEAGSLYRYSVEWIRRFPGPVPVKVRKKGASIDRKDYSFKKLSSFDPIDLLYLHSYCHSGHSIDIKEFHDVVATEMANRGLIHPYYSWLDRDIIGLIKDHKRYNPENITNAVLLDDHRIACAIWPDWLKRNPDKKFQSQQFKEMSRTDQVSAIRHLCTVIQKEMRKRGMEPKVKFPLSIPKPKDMKYGDINEIDTEYVKSLTDSELKALIMKLHSFFQEEDDGEVKEPVGNAHIFAWSELRARGLKYPGPKDGLYKANFSSVVEYPAPPSEKESSSIERLYLEDFLEMLPEQFSIEEPPAQIWLIGGMVNRGYCDDQDIDILIKQDYPDMRIFRELVNQIQDPMIREKIHPVFSGEGPEIGYSIPLYRDSYQRLNLEATLSREISPGSRVKHLKPKSGIGKHEFFTIQDMWDTWAASRIDKGIIVEKKYDGMGFSIHYIPDKLTKFVTEDRSRDRTDMFPKAVEELKKIKSSFVAIAEMVQYDCKGKSVKNKEELCEALPREDMIPWITTTKKLDDSNIVFHIHELLFLDEKDIHGLPHVERLNKLDSLIPNNLGHLKTVPYTVAKSKASFESAVNKMRNLPGSEGVVAKQIDAIYSFSGRTGEFAKLKNLKEIDVLVWSPIEKKTSEGKGMNQWVYDCAFAIPSGMENKFSNEIVTWKGKKYAIIGRSYSTATRCRRGDVVTIRPIRIRIYDKGGKHKVTWMFPYFEAKREKKSVDTWTTVQRIAKMGTGSMSLSEVERIYLAPCPYTDSKEVCPLYNRFERPDDNASLAKVSRMQLKFPIRCQLASMFKCPLVKDYYYEMSEPIEVRNWSLPLTEQELSDTRTLPHQSDQPCKTCTESGVTS